MISERAKGMVRIIELHDHLYRGGPKSSYATTTVLRLVEDDQQLLHSLVQYVRSMRR
jgi:hypothetical protein